MTSLPFLADALSKCQLAWGLVRIWENRLRHQKSEEGEAAKEGPRTVLAVQFMKIVNLIPQDAPHPLYHLDYVDFTNEFILDHLSSEKFDAYDPRVDGVDGLTIRTISGKSLVFTKKGDSDKYFVNDIEILSFETLPDETIVISIDGFLFDHYKRVQEAFNAIRGTGKCFRC